MTTTHPSLAQTRVLAIAISTLKGVKLLAHEVTHFASASGQKKRPQQDGSQHAGKCRDAFQRADILAFLIVVAEGEASIELNFFKSRHKGKLSFSVSPSFASGLLRTRKRTRTFSQSHQLW
jgi:hypothetical protein